MDTELIGSTLIPIDKNGKYIIQLYGKVDQIDVDHIKAKIDRWLESAEPIIVIGGEFKIIEIKGNDGRY